MSCDVEWSPWACDRCSVPIPPAPVVLCDPHEATYLRAWAPHGISRDEAVTEAAKVVDLLPLHADLVGGLNSWLGRSPAWAGDIHQTVDALLGRHTQRVTAGAVLIRLSPHDVLALRGSVRSDREDILARAATGSSNYHCPAVAGLAWRLSGVHPDVAHRFEQRLHGDEDTRCRPTSRDEVVETPHLHPFLAWDCARDWQRHLTGDPDAPLHTTSLDELADQLDRDYPYLRRPASLTAYTDAGFSPTEAVAWHRLLVSTGLVGDSDAASDSATRWQHHGFDLQTLTTWTRTSGTVLRGRSLFERDAETHATLRDGDFPDVATALPWLELWAKYADAAPSLMRQLWEAETPLDWAESWLASQVHP